MKKMFQNSNVSTLKKMFILLTCTLFLTLFTQAQKGPLSGSGNIIEKTYSFSGFDKVNLYDLDGNLAVESGKAFSVTLAIDDNLLPLLETSVKNNTLTVQLKGNKQNRLYIENTNIRVKITLPEISVLEHTGNSRLQVSGINGRYFRIKNTGNGDASITGTIDELDIIKRGNGSVNTRLLAAKQVKVTASGNGQVSINTPFNFNALVGGNGNVINYGIGTADASSEVRGNSQVIYQPVLPQPRIDMEDLKPVAGKWKGTLQYLDYSSREQVSIPCNMEVEIMEKTRKIVLSYIYPEETKYNSSDVILINETGDRMGDATVIEKTNLAGGGVKVVTEEKGTDDNKPCTTKRVITLTANKFVITKMVKFDGEATFFQRNEYNWNR
jgi:Putative auto-transporter adhesin, head GIN domain